MRLEWRSMWANDLEERGFAIIGDVLSSIEISSLIEELGSDRLGRSRAGRRHALTLHRVRMLANDSRLLEMARDILGCAAIPFRATLFDKSPTSNWLVVWHQDTALPLRERREVPGWGPWSVKAGVSYAHAPATTLSKIVALRVHLDDSDASNGPLRVLPGTHLQGVLTDDQILELVGRLRPCECLVPKGGVLAMSPLIVHSSSKSRAEIPRRVLHIEYAASLVPAEGLELAIA